MTFYQSFRLQCCNQKSCLSKTIQPQQGIQQKGDLMLQIKRKKKIEVKIIIIELFIINEVKK